MKKRVGLKNVFRFFPMFLLFVLVVAGCYGCGERQLSENGEELSGETETNVATTGEIRPDHRTVSCRQVAEEEWVSVRILDHATSVQVQLELPSDWTLEKTDPRNYRILRQGQAIGALTLDELPPAEAEFSVRSGYSHSNVHYEKKIAWRETEGIGGYNREFDFSCRQDGSKLEFSFWVDQKELNDAAAEALVNAAEPVPATRKIPSIKEGNGAGKILVLGNSFVNTSKIGAFLEDMFIQGKTGVEVEAISIGMANITTFTERASICTDIQRGKYSHVFLCGFYSDSVLEDLNTIRGLCHISKTTLVAFPAHNESASTVKNAQAQYRDLAILDWKGKINDLLEAGVPDALLYINDSHKHSTPLAGYVGAHLIYEVLFEAAPPEITSRSPVSAGEKNEMLGQYLHLLPRTPAFEGSVFQMNEKA